MPIPRASNDRSILLKRLPAALPEDDVAATEDVWLGLIPLELGPLDGVAVVFNGVMTLSSM